MVEAELTRLVEKRSRRDPDPDELEPGYVESVRRYHAKRRREIRAEWYTYHAGQAERLRRTMEPLIAFHEARAQQLLEEGAA